MRRWILGLWLLFSGIPMSHAGDALQAIDDCLARLDGATDVGFERISARCPQLAPALSASPGAAWLPADWSQPGNALSSRSLTELRAMLVRELAAHESRPAPSTQRVAAVLAAVTESESTERSWWARFTAWLREALAPRRRNADESWLQRWTAGLSLSRATRRLIGWAALALVVGIAVRIILNELRVAGVLAPRDPRIAGRRPLFKGQGPVSLADIDGAEVSSRPRLLLELIAARLTAEQRLPAARALTAGEVWRRARLPSEDSRRHLAELARVCERLRFAGTPVSSPSIAAAIESGRSVLTSLDAVADAGP